MSGLDEKGLEAARAAFYGPKGSVVAAISAYLAALDAETEGWRTMDSAPKDGTWLLLWCDFPIVGRWEANGERVKCGWTDDVDGVNPIYMVTHWHPLPSPPESRS